MRGIKTAALASSLAVSALIPAVAAQAGTIARVTVTTVRSGLNAPKHLTLTRDGLFVAESGAGGTVGAANCVTGISTSGGPTKYCEGRTAAVTLIGGKKSGTVLGGLPSVIQESTGEVAGPGAIAFNRDGQAAVVIQDVLVNKHGGNSLPKPLGFYFGKLLLISGRKAIAVNIARFAATHPQPDYSLGNSAGETRYDSDPYDVAAYGSGFVVADAAANSLLQVSKWGKVSLLARFPYLSEVAAAHTLGNPQPVTVEAQAVPTSVAVGPDGALYVGLLRGVPSDPGTAYIYRVVPGQAPTIWAKGLTAVTSIAFDRWGRLLATEYSQAGLLAPPTVPGALVRISADGRIVTTLPVSGLYQPTGVAVGWDGTVYVSNYGGNLATAAHPGEVLKITGLG